MNSEEDLPEISQHEAAKLDLTIGALERGTDVHTELERRNAALGNRVVSPRPDWQPNRLQRVGRSVIAKIAKRLSK